MSCLARIWRNEAGTLTRRFASSLLTMVETNGCTTLPVSISRFRGAKPRQSLTWDYMGYHGITWAVNEYCANLPEYLFSFRALNRTNQKQSHYSAMRVWQLRQMACKPGSVPAHAGDDHSS